MCMQDQGSKCPVKVEQSCGTFVHLRWPCSGHKQHVYHIYMHSKLCDNHILILCAFSGSGMGRRPFLCLNINQQTGVQSVVGSTLCLLYKLSVTAPATIAGYTIGIFSKHYLVVCNSCPWVCVCTWCVTV